MFAKLEQPKNVCLNFEIKHVQLYWYNSDLKFPKICGGEEKIKMSGHPFQCLVFDRVVRPRDDSFPEAIDIVSNSCWALTTFGSFCLRSSVSLAKSGSTWLLNRICWKDRDHSLRDPVWESCCGVWGRVLTLMTSRKRPLPWVLYISSNVLWYCRPARKYLTDRSVSGFPESWPNMIGESKTLCISWKAVGPTWQVETYQSPVAYQHQALVHILSNVREWAQLE